MRRWKWKTWKKWTAVAVTATMIGTAAPLLGQSVTQPFTQLLTRQPLQPLTRVFGTSAVTALAAEAWNPDRKVNLTIDLKSEKKKATIHLYRVAEWDGGSGTYVMTGAFSETGETIGEMTADEMLELAGRIYRYAQRSGIQPDFSGQTVRGELQAEELSQGIYLVAQNRQSSDNVTINPYLMTLPEREEDGWKYEMTAYPKTISSKPGGGGGGDHDHPSNPTEPTESVPETPTEPTTPEMTTVPETPTGPENPDNPDHPDNPDNPDDENNPRNRRSRTGVLPDSKNPNKKRGPRKGVLGDGFLPATGDPRSLAVSLIASLVFLASVTGMIVLIRKKKTDEHHEK